MRVPRWVILAKAGSIRAQCARQPSGWTRLRAAVLSMLPKEVLTVSLPVPAAPSLVGKDKQRRAARAEKIHPPLLNLCVTACLGEYFLIVAGVRMDPAFAGTTSVGHARHPGAFARATNDPLAYVGTRIIYPSARLSVEEET